ncbi:MAG: TIGR03960 family B12-binding radical SAM protein [Eggerthellaceae bacterium]|jgi:radical SAM family uncharacterized protein
MPNLWNRIEGLLPLVERPARYINHEWGSVTKQDFDFHFCMVYPDTYELGQPNQAIRILVNAVNAFDEGMFAERAYLPALDMCTVMRDENIPLFSLETYTPLADFDAIGITLPHELAATNVLEVIDLANLPIHAEKRSETDPFVIAGGPCTYNPEPYAPFFDAMNIGEGEESLPEGLAVIRRLRAEKKTRKEILLALAQIDGWYVPQFYDWLDEEEAQKQGSWINPRIEGLPTRIEKRVFEGFAESSAWEPCVVPYAETVHDRLNVEILRGCNRSCRFCQAGMIYRPVRERSADNIVESVVAGLAETGYDEVSLTSLSTTDHSQISEILTRLNKIYENTGVRISIPSQRLDSFGVDMAGLVAGQKKGGLTFAPEAGTQRLRNVINKNVKEEDLFGAIDAAFKAGWRRCKLYFMIGLPTETDDDIKGIASLAQRAYDHARTIVPPDQRGSIRLSVSCALFVPKAHTPFQWDGQISSEEALRRVNLLRSSVKYRAIDVHWHNPDTSFIEAVMSRGGREVAAWVEEAWKRGAHFDAWSELFNRQAWEDAAEVVGIDSDAIAEKTYPTSYVMPWSHISSGVSSAFLARERKRAEEETCTEDCSFGPCAACGVCTQLHTANILAAPRLLDASDQAKPNPHTKVGVN